MENEIEQPQGSTMAKKPNKEINSITVNKVANGYSLTYGYGVENVYIFTKIDEALDFINKQFNNPE